jgi:D-galactose 1-dehydrogenase
MLPLAKPSVGLLWGANGPADYGGLTRCVDCSIQLLAKVEVAMRRIGLIGLGRIARERHIPTIAVHAAFVLAAVADPHGDLSSYGCPAFTSYVDMLSAVTDLDAVAICTPPGVRCRIALDAIEAGKDVLLEKPPAATVEELALLRSAADRAARVVFTAWHSQHNEAVAVARSLLSAETVAQVSIIWKEDIHHYHPGQEWLWRAGGFGVFDPGVNALSILTRILPRRPIVRGADLFIQDGVDTPIAAHVALGIEALPGTCGAAEFDGRGKGDALREITVVTQAGTTLRLANGGSRLLVNDRLVVDGKRAEYRQLYDHFAQLLDTRTTEIDPVPLGLANDALTMGRRLPSPTVPDETPLPGRP